MTGLLIVLVRGQTSLWPVGTHDGAAHRTCWGQTSLWPVGTPDGAAHRTC